MPPEISVIFPLTPAVDRVKRLLFSPIDPAKWFVIGFCAWLAMLGEGGFPGGYGFKGGPGPTGGNVAGNIKNWFNETTGYVVSNLMWIIPLAATVAVVGLAVWALILWLNSRGQFMFLHCVATEKAEVRGPWNEYAREARSLFLFRLAMTGIALLMTIPSLAGVAFFLFPMISGNGTAMTVAAIVGMVVLGLLTFVLMILWKIVAKLTRDFVVPIQLTRRCACGEAWRILLGLVSQNLGSFVLYFLFQIVLHMAMGILVFVVVLVTCCIAGCVLAIPYIGTVLMLPLLIFQRAYSIHYLAQYGRQFSPVDSRQ